jgi:hypothetical protein
LTLVIHHVFTVELLGGVADADPKLRSGAGRSFPGPGENWFSRSGNGYGAELASLPAMESDADSLSGAVRRAAVRDRRDDRRRGRLRMNTTFQKSVQVLSVGIFCSQMIIGLSSSLLRACIRAGADHL